ARRELLRRRLARARAATPRAELLPRPADVPAPLSAAQRRMWFLAQYEPDGAAYNMPLVLRLSGPPDEDALAAALTDVVARHEVLRTVYPSLDGQVLPTVHDVDQFRVDVLDVPGPELADLLAAEARRPFELATEIPIRAALLRSDGRWTLSVVLHHIAADGWSVGVLFRDLAAAYTARCAGHPPMLPPLPVQYADVAYRQQTTLADELDRQQGWWRARLDGAPGTVTVPVDRPRPAVADTRGERIQVGFGADRSRRIRALAERTGGTTYMVLLAALQTVLARYNGVTDVTVGSPVAGRTHRSTDHLIGCFVNTLAMRTDLSGEPTVRELLARVREDTLAAFARQELPFDRLIDALGLERELAYTPLFQVLLNVHNQAAAHPTLAGIEVEWGDTYTGAAKFDLAVAVLDTGPADELVADLVWRSVLYDEATIRRTFGHLTTILDAMTADPDRPVADLPLLTAGEERLLAGWNDTARDWDATGTLHALIEEQARRTPDAPAVRGADGVLSYGELDARANALAYRLRAAGVGPDRPVGLFVERSAALIVGMLGILKAGGAYLPLDPLYPDERIRALLAAADAVAVVATPDLRARVAGPLPI
ncbi:condensation domain-containing protein, partial [Streptomyces sp. SID3343]|uniref:condensation domain-containing protein n=1 Tax=Streptomyces sp. SID3343 TaxID=2690260 RepID=UPI00136891CF